MSVHGIAVSGLDHMGLSIAMALADRAGLTDSSLRIPAAPHQEIIDRIRDDAPALWPQWPLRVTRSRCLAPPI